MPQDKQDRQEKDILSKRSFPTALSSKDIRIFWSDQLKKQSLFSARTTSKEYLDTIKNLLADYQKTLGQTQAGEPITQGLQRTRMLMREKLVDLGLVERDAEGNIVDKMTNLASTIRLNLIIKTNSELAHSAQQKLTSQDPLQQILRPYWELVRNEVRNKPRNWYDRWLTCANKVGWQGVIKNTSRMIARTDSPIWFELGHSFIDSIGTDMPPFSWNSGMGWKSISAKEIKELGLEEG